MNPVTRFHPFHSTPFGLECGACFFFLDMDRAATVEEVEYATANTPGGCCAEAKQ